jgi:putative flippase GtrA
MGDNLGPWLLGFAIGFILAGVVGFVSSRILYWRRARDIGERIATAESKVEAEPEKAKPAWDLAGGHLEDYINQNLSQITDIFFLGALAMIVGFVVIIVGTVQAIQSPDTFVPTAIASAAGVITEFIGATFLFVYRSTIQQASGYSRTLERINSVGMAMQILDTIPDGAKPEDLKSKTKATLAELIIRQAHEASEKTENNKGKG